jgi:type II secretory pathway pseudopilin PulG
MRAPARSGRTLRHARQRLAGEDGISLTELLVVVAILGTIIAGLSQLFVGASRSQVDQTNRTGAQQGARLALVKLRREIHCASAVSPNPNGTWPTRSVTIVLGSLCPTYQSGIASVTWCTVGGGAPYSLWRYPHTADLRAQAYANACANTGSGGTKWATDIVNAAGVTGGGIFGTAAAPFGPGAMPAPSLTANSSGGSLTVGTNGYVVDPVTAAGEQPGGEATVNVTTGGSVTINWSANCPPYSGVTNYKVYGRTPSAENLLTITGSGVCSYTDTGAATTAGSPVSGDTLTRVGVNIPVRLGSSGHGLFVLTDSIALRNTPR